ncbi:D-alanyl-D-alanine carboxypeptidase family protein [Gulosibacter chungangensis]|uniref:D-alanyl-D-alanine carboxypeptidase family protein n=1 Tax=Gulosibacter chungangensis TaxID=979746 RepID=A0A7J5BFM6_9MICO|nr:D-alanyl-D-alanine carboxypeptidase family protein [Gulosibacter chungangensis]KAB1645034.1 D-alanyl-D-alanine carboxypeptidase family protein [Gulosibacter chungangensis]
MTTEHEDAAPPTKSKAPQVTRVIASVALLAATAAGIGIASGWGSPSEPLSIAPPTANSSHGLTLTVTPSFTSADGDSTDLGANPTGDEATASAESTTGAPTDPGNTEATPQYDITTASSITVLVNKQVPLDPADYAPDDLVYMNEIGVSSINEHALRHDAAFAVKEMFAAAAEAGHVLDMTSGYRDYDLQTHLYDGYVEEQGQEAADSTSARPGYSEHQTGLAADISAPDSDPFCILDGCFGDTLAGQWLAENAWQYGFILRFPEGETAVTGYEYEPWHYRFIGVDAAADFHESGAATYEEFLGADAAPDYD